MIPALINHLWQSTLFAGTAGLLTLTLRKNGAGVRYGLWFAASVKFLIPFALLAAAGRLAVQSLHLSIFRRHDLDAITPMIEPFVAAPAVPQISPAAVPHLALSAPHAAVPLLDPVSIGLAVWALGLAVLLWAWAVRWSRIRAALRAATPARLPAPLPVLSTPVPMEPGVIGLLRPVLIVPEGIAERLSPAEWNAVLTHELCHVRRRDNLTGAIHMAVQALFWFHPLVWWLGARLVAERERACDEAVIGAGADGHTYAEGLLKVCRLYLRQPLACTAGVSGANLKRRVQRILNGSRSVRLGAAKTLMLVAAALLSLAAPLSAGILASAPMAARAQAANARPAPPAPLAQAPEVAAAPDATAPPVADTPQVAKPIVLAAVETALSPAPEVAPADDGAAPVAAGLSQAPPDLHVQDVTSGESTMKNPVVQAAFVLALAAGSPALAQTVYTPPGPEPRFGGEFSLSDVGQVAGYWRSQCYNWHVRSQSRRTGPVASPEVDSMFKRFVSGLIAEKPDYDAFSPAMAEAVRKNLPTDWASINRMGHASVAKRFDTDAQGNGLYVLDLAGGRAHWNLTVDPQGKIASAFICQGQGL